VEFNAHTCIVGHLMLNKLFWPFVLF